MRERQQPAGGRRPVNRGRGHVPESALLPSSQLSRVPSPSAVLPHPIFCLITDRALAAPRPLGEVVDAAVAGGVNMVQLREKDVPTRLLVDLAARLRDVTRGRALLLVNGRADVAFTVNADGVHLPSDGMPAAGARMCLGGAALIGRSVHSVPEVASSARAGSDYVELGTVFPSRSHPGGATLGIAAIRAATDFGVPIVAVGGIRADNVGPVIEAGATGIAVISAVIAQADPRKAARTLWEALLAAGDRQPPSRGEVAERPMRRPSPGRPHAVHG
ncbi:MAG: thiamine phosphate synthase [Chloroflexi bacterium]|nr:thiamine phosphate synthase [Chloroflexota bacterium]